MTGRPEAVDTDKDHIKIKFSPPISNGGSPIIGYEIERRDLNNPRWIKVSKEPVRNTEFRDEKVSEGHQYEYRVSAGTINAFEIGGKVEFTMLNLFPCLQ